MKIYFILVCISTIYCTSSIEFVSNFNKQKVKETYNDELISIPAIVKKSLEKRNTKPISSKFNIRKHELKDSDYEPDLQRLSDQEERILFDDLPIPELFDFNSFLFEDYQVLEIRDFRLVLTNPTMHFKFCLTDIVSDSEALKRMQHMRLPFCINPGTRYPLYFRMHLAQYRPKTVFKTTIYIMLEIYDKKTFVANKVWTRQVFTKLNQNFLRLGPLEAKNCGKNYTTLTISNYQPHHIKVNFDSQEEKASMRQVMIPSQKSFKMTIMPTQKIMSISARPYEVTDVRYPKLYMPIYCESLLEIDEYDIGILNSERSITQFPLLISTNSRNEYIQISKIQCTSSAETVEILPAEGSKDHIEPNRAHKLIGRIILHLNKVTPQKSSINIKITYSLASNPKQFYVAQHQFKYFEFKNPLTFSSKRFINVREMRQKAESKGKPNILDNIFSIRNNLNVPMQFLNVIHNNDVFKVTPVNELKQFIYPNHQKDSFSLQYLGPLELEISPVKFIITLQFNGRLFIPIEIVVYDESLQCVYNNIQQKCSKLAPIDYGYFRNNNPKSKQLVIRNWNPTSVQLEINLIEDITEQFGMNFTITIFGPFPNYDMPSHRFNNTLFYYLKGGHFIIINFTVSPMDNATSGVTKFAIKTQHQQLTTSIKFKIENATIALIPQVIRINSLFERSVQYLNLVSTYSEPYKIRSTSVNVSNINVFSKNDSQIYENQWVGLALVFEPFVTNITETCCGNQFAVNSFINSLYLSENRKSIYALVRIQTTTDLQANSTVIIDNNIPKLIKQSNITIRLMKTKNTQPIKIRLKNVFTQPLKFSVVLTPDYLYRDSRQFMLAMRRARKSTEEAMFCVNNGITIRHNFSPQMVKTLFNLNSVPQQITIQPLQNSEYYIDSQRKSFQGTSKQFSKYVIDTVNEGARICYRIHTSKYIKELIETKVLNDLAENHSNELFLQFVEKQMEYFNVPFYFLQNDEFYDNLSIDLQGYCTQNMFPLFRFCKQINLVINSKPETVIIPNQQYDIELQIGQSSLKEFQYSFYLTILNNITKYQSHYTSIILRQPKLSLQNLYVNQQISVPKSVLDTQHFKERDWIRFLGKPNFDYVEDHKQLNRIKANTLPIVMAQEQLVNHSYVGYRTFSIKNKGHVDVKFSHIGIENIENTCKNEYVEILQTCKEVADSNKSQQPEFVMGSEQEKNITIKINYPQEQYSNIPKKTNLYLYYKDKYYFNIQLALKLPENSNIYVTNYQAVYSLLLNIISLIFLIFVILIRSKQTGETTLAGVTTEPVITHKLLPHQCYHELGTKLQKKKRKLNIFIDDQILAFKEHQDKKLKDYFNQSIQSQIQKKNITGEQETSNNILQELKHPLRNSGVLSEESSVEYIDIRDRSYENADSGVKSPEDNSGFIEHDDEDSLFEEGGEQEREQRQTDYAWGNESNQNKNDKQSNSGSHYNIFLSQNPLKKETKDPFHWMQDFQRNQKW